MRFGLVMLALGVCLSLAGRSLAHPADEFQQVYLQLSIDDEKVSLLARVPAPCASKELFDGESPIETDRMEPADLAKRVQPLLAAMCPVSIDGVVVPPTVVKAEMRMEGSRLPVRSFSLPQTMERGYLIFMAEYETKGKPRRVDMDWTVYANAYDEDDQPLTPDEELLVVIVTRAYEQQSYAVVTPVEPRYTWHSDESFALPADLLATKPVQREFVTLPAVSIGIWLVGGVTGLVLFRWRRRAARLVLMAAAFVGVLVVPLGGIEIEKPPSYAELDEVEALTVFETLHRNIYRAFDYTDEGSVYDALAESVDGPMLEAIYNDVYQSLIMREENGAVSKAVRVEIEEAAVVPAEETDEAFDANAYRIACTWQVDGLVTHFGHTHERTNEFEAVYTLAPREQGWRIVGAEILQQRRIDEGAGTEEDPADTNGLNNTNDKIDPQ
ncbi:MAG: hypothetical protein AAF085_04440 [Planctomycetota bacterium]